MKYFTIQKEILHSNIIPPPSLPGHVTSYTLHSCVLVYLCLSSYVYLGASPLQRWRWHHNSASQSLSHPHHIQLATAASHRGYISPRPPWCAGKNIDPPQQKHHPTSITGMKSEVGVNGLLFHRYVKRLQSYNQPRRKQAKKTCK